MAQICLKYEFLTYDRNNQFKNINSLDVQFFNNNIHELFSIAIKQNADSAYFSYFQEHF